MPDQETPFQWLECGGGPLILLSGEYVPAWLGYTRAASIGAPSGGTRPSGQTDYERAHTVQDDLHHDLGLLAVDGGQGLVLSTEPMAIAWWAISSAEGILVCWMVGAEAATVSQYLAHIEEQIWAPSGITFAVGRRPLYAFDAILPGSEATAYLAEYLMVRLAEGQYDVDTGIARPDTQTELMLHRFRRQ
jgi:hypothetical protein